MNSFCGASILRFSRGIVNRHDQSVRHALRDILRRGSENALNLSDFSLVPQRLFDRANIKINLLCDFRESWLFCSFFFFLGQCCSPNLK